MANQGVGEVCCSHRVPLVATPKVVLDNVSSELRAIGAGLSYCAHGIPPVCSSDVALEHVPRDVSMQVWVVALTRSL